MESAFKGLKTMSSGWASVCMDDGVCEKHGRHLTARSWCKDFAAG